MDENDHLVGHASLPDPSTTMLDKYDFSYRRKLPHIQPEGSTLFVTFRLYGTIPHAQIEAWNELRLLRGRQIQASDQLDKRQLLYEEQLREFGRYDRFLDAAQHGPRWLKDPEIAQLIVDSLRFYDDKRYRLDAYTIMSNHVHVVFAPLQRGDGGYYPLRSIMHSIKSYSANKANEILGETGQTFWQAESYDHFVRNEQEWQRIIQYVLNNPVKAGLVASWEEWPWSHSRYAQP